MQTPTYTNSNTKTTTTFSILYTVRNKDYLEILTSLRQLRTAYKSMLKLAATNTVT